MITLNDIQSFVVSGPTCQNSFPCGHNSTVTLKDGRAVSYLNSFQIWSIVSELANEKINPQGGWGAEGVKRHFKEYSESIDGWVVEPANVVLNKIFAGVVLKQPSFDMEEMLANAKEYARGDEELLAYITERLQDDSFKKSPEDYLAVWKRERGTTQNCKIPEDNALCFFDQYFKF